jgi:signal transduction histidine kinase
MRLRTKLATAFGGLLLIVAAIGLHDIALIGEMSRSVDVVLRENYRSVLVCQEMKESLERIDGGATIVLLGDRERGEVQIDRSRERFRKALAVELGNITLPGEGALAESVRKQFADYEAGLAAFRDPGLSREAQHRVYLSRLLPNFLAIKDGADAILRMNQKHMEDSDLAARNKAASARRQTWYMLAAATLAAAGFLAFTAGSILRPIRRLTDSAEEIRKGNLDLVLPVESVDEIGRLSASFNEMAGSLREFRRSGQARMLRIQRSVQQAFDALPDAIAVLDPDGRVEVATRSARDVFGLRPESRLADLRLEGLDPVVSRALATGRPAQSEAAPIQRFSGPEERFWLPRAIPILDPDRTPAGVLLILEDVTRRREQDELKRGVISTVSHQLKTPLTSIRMAIHLMLGEKIGPLSEKQAEVMLAAREDAERLNGILADLLDISRIESGRGGFAFRAIPADALALSAVEPLRSAALDRGVRLETSLPEGLPDGWADPERISHVFDNLLSNALRHTPAGGTVTLSAEADDRYVRFRVSDTGSGIPERYLPELFEPFFRVPGQGAETGVGLGLSIVKEIVEAHGGTVRAESRPGEGSSFIFTIKRADSAPREA